MRKNLTKERNRLAFGNNAVYAALGGKNPLVTDLKKEKEINTFFRLQNPTIISRLKDTFSDLPENPSSKEVFIKLRELRNNW